MLDQCPLAVHGVDDEIVASLSGGPWRQRQSLNWILENDLEARQRAPSAMEWPQHTLYTGFGGV